MSKLIYQGQMDGNQQGDRISTLMNQNKQIIDLQIKSATLLIQQLQSLNFRLEHLIDTVQLSCIANVTGKFPVDMSQFVLIQDIIRHPHLMDFSLPLNDCKSDPDTDGFPELDSEPVKAKVAEAIKQWGEKLGYQLTIYGDFAIKDVQKSVNNAEPKSNS